MTNDNPLQIREATVADAAYISLLGRVTFAETFGHHFSDPQDLLDYHERTFSVSKIRAGLQKRNNVFWLATLDELPVGYAKLKLDAPSAFVKEQKIAQLQKIYVLKDFLSLKIGYALQEELIRKARQNGYRYLWLSVLDSNERAIRFYLKNGFEKIGNHQFDIGKEHFGFLALGKHLE